MFQEFLAFQQFKAAQRAVPASAPAEDVGSVTSTPSVALYRPAVRRVNYERVLFEILPKLKPNPIKNKNPGIWKLYQAMLLESPDDFALTGEGHNSPDGRFYFSFRYTRGYATANFHVFGEVQGTHFLAHTIDILHSSVEVYRAAVDYRRD